MLTRTYLVSRFWVWGLVVEAVSAAALFVYAGWGTGSLLSLSGVPLRLLATFVAIWSAILLRLTYVMNQERLLLQIDERGVAGREPSGDLWPEAVEFRIDWDQLADVSVVGTLINRVQILDRHARAHIVNLLMVEGLKGGEGEVLAAEIRSAYAEWRGRSDQ